MTSDTLALRPAAPRVFRVRRWQWPPDEAGSIVWRLGLGVPTSSSHVSDLVSSPPCGGVANPSPDSRTASSAWTVEVAALAAVRSGSRREVRLLSDDQGPGLASPSAGRGSRRTSRSLQTTIETCSCVAGEALRFQPGRDNLLEEVPSCACRPKQMLDRPASGGPPEHWLAKPRLWNVCAEPALPRGALTDEWNRTFSRTPITRLHLPLRIRVDRNRPGQPAP